MWLIVDDGSTDGTKALVETWSADFSIRYIRQENGGKHRALNTGISQISTPFTFIVDSDDVLTEDAIEDASVELTEILDREEICGVGYLRGYAKDKVIGDRYPKDHEITDFITVRFKQKVSGDKAEIWRTADLKQIPFPEIAGEKFISEGYVWCRLAYTKKIVCINKIIYITEYLPGGLSDSGRSMRINCPIGGMMSANVMMNSKFDFVNRIKGGLLFNAYAGFAGKNLLTCLKESESKTIALLTYIPGRMLCCHWKRPYGK